jgi:single-strand DNA-binding protein
MANLNKVLLMGNLTRDPEVRYTPKGTAVANLGLAVNRVYTTETGEQKEEVTFIEIEVWGRQAETAGQYLSKGRPVFIEGRLKLDSWDDKETGQKRNRLRVVAERIQFLGAPRGTAEFKEQPPADEAAARPAPGRGRAAPPRPAAPPEEEPPPPEEDNIPF